MATRARGRDGGLWQWIVEQGEERLGQLAEEVSRNKSLTDALGKTLKQAAQTKGQLDRNMQTFLALLNLPSKADYQKLLTKIETLQGSLINVNMKLDRLVAASAKPKPKAKTKHKHKAESGGADDED